MNDLFDQNEQVILKKELSKEPFLSQVTRTQSACNVIRTAQKHNALH